MQNNSFRRPLAVDFGIGFIREIGDPAEALAFLNDWSRSRGPLHAMALQACAASLAGECDPESARRAFAAFVKANGVLVASPDSAIPALNVPTAGRQAAAS